MPPAPNGGPIVGTNSLQSLWADLHSRVDTSLHSSLRITVQQGSFPKVNVILDLFDYARILICIS